MSVFPRLDELALQTRYVLSHESAARIPRELLLPPPHHHVQQQQQQQQQQQGQQPELQPQPMGPHLPQQQQQQGGVGVGGGGGGGAAEGRPSPRAHGRALPLT